MNIPERYKNWDKVSFDKINTGDYIAYYNKNHTTFDGVKKKEGFKAGGYCTFKENDEKENKKFIGLKNNYGRQWTIQDRNVSFYLISPNSISLKKK